MCLIVLMLSLPSHELVLLIMSYVHDYCGEWHQSSAVESPAELVAPCNVSEDNLVDIKSVQVQLSVSPMICIRVICVKNKVTWEKMHLM